jgi:transcriptional regulator with XRE-family HTH domain
MPLLSSQCRAARALLGWSQDNLEARSRVAKKTIADFERDARNPNPRTSLALQTTLEAFGIVFIPENGGGAGVRLIAAMPRLFRRSDVPDRNWVAFAFDYKDKRHTGFISHVALGSIALDQVDPVSVFDRDQERILLHAARMVDAEKFDPEGRVLIQAGDLLPIGSDIASPD